ncbi:hypothetical protein IFM89_014444 [Coptis chinensis]|uniref:Uncharacterized protein n=1 Tax=Coptis chinensis TaxID=261450 RepID=A0A835LVQ2_9MAGN|nr:hypothetical protein IFM89_014444 [Coptis chinensis]
MFTDDDSSGWVSCVEQHHKVSNVPKNNMVNLVAAHLTGDVIPWFQGLVHVHGILKPCFELLSLLIIKKKPLQYLITRKPTFRPNPIRSQVATLTSSSYIPLSILGPAPIRRLSPTEQVDRHSKGLHFNYDEQYKPWHRYKNLQLLLLEGDNSFVED